MRSKARERLIADTARVLVALLVLLLTATAEAGTVIVSPASGPAGSRVTLNGSGFPGRAKVRVAAAGRRAATAKANARGGFGVKVTIPRGAQTIGLRSRARSHRVKNIFRITPGPVPLSRELANSRGERLRWTPADPVAGSSVAISGRGLPPSARVRIRLSKVARAAITLRTNRAGTLDASVPIPVAARGAHMIRVRVRRRTMRLPVTLRANTGPGPCGMTSAARATWQHVVWIVMENHSYSQVIGSPSAPYENALAAQCGLATNYVAITHPSLPNYIAMTSGETQGVTDDSGPSSHPLNVPSIFSQLGTGGWRSLQESMPSNCYLSSSGQYAVRHNPAAYYTNIRSDCQTYDVPLGATPDISAPFTFVTPNLCNDTHDCPVTTGDDWLKTFIPKLTSSPEYQAGSTAIFLTWDEDDFTDVNQIATIVIAPSTVPGTRSATRFHHYSLLRTTEEMLGLTTYLGAAAGVTSMRSAFNL
jgi:phosphatidylinositol-3-phosphatase